MLICEIEFFHATNSIICGILCQKYLFFIKTRALDDNSSSGSTPSFFICEHEAIGQSSQHVLIVRQKISLDCELIEPIHSKRGCVDLALF